VKRVPLSQETHPAGTRLLVIEAWYSNGAGDECIIVEWAPSGERVKLQYVNAITPSWKETERMRVVEVLLPTKEPKL
jgi:hypothetical protein